MVKKRIAPLLTRIDTFLRAKIIRSMFAQKDGVDFKEVIENKKILLIKLSQGLIGEQNSYLLGSIFISKLNQIAQGRQSISKEDRHPFYIYIDEFHNLITPSITSILSGARKYGIGLILAHQELSQIEDNRILNSVISNPYTRICFRLGDNDAKKLELGFSFFEQSDLQSSGIGKAIMRVGSSSNDFNIQTKKLEELNEYSEKIKQQIILNTRNQYAKPQKEVIPKQDVEKTDIEKQKEAFIQQASERESIRKHRSLQNYVRTISMQRGFIATLEKETSNGGRIDVSLVRDDIRIAIEVSVTNTINYEVKNIQKCIDEEYNYILVLSESEIHLRNIKKRAFENLTLSEKRKIKFFEPDKLIVFLDSLEEKKKPRVKKIRGYRVKSNHIAIDTDMSEEKNNYLKDIILHSMKKKSSK